MGKHRIFEKRLIEISVDDIWADFRSDEEPENSLPSEEAASLSDSWLNESLQEAVDGIKELKALFTDKILHTQHEEKILDAMHSELTKHRQDMYSQLARPILLDIAAVRDDIMSMAAIVREKPEDERHIGLAAFELYADQLLEIMAKNRIDTYISEPEAEFCPATMRAVKKIAADDESLHGKVASSVADGYLYDGKKILPERVEVYFYSEPTQNNEQDE